MHSLRHLTSIYVNNVIQKQSVKSLNVIENLRMQMVIAKYIQRSIYTSTCYLNNRCVAIALRNTKSRKPSSYKSQYFVDIRQVKVRGGKGGNGVVSFLQLWMNDTAGPDGGDGGNGGHVIFKVSENVKDLSGISSVIEAENGEKGSPKNCYGKNADHTIVRVPEGTIVRNINGNILADLDKEGTMFVAARGGAGGHGNTFFKSSVQQSPKICECGADGESMQYLLEIKSMAHIGLVGFPNAGKSTLLRAISRAKPKVAAYPFTTLKPHIGMILYDDYEQIAVADLPGLISESHKNKGLGITFLKHAERCTILLYIVDITDEEPWRTIETLKYEINKFNTKLLERPHFIVANKIDLPGAEENLMLLKQKTDTPIIPISAKLGNNISTLLTEIRVYYDKLKEEELSTHTRSPI